MGILLSYLLIGSICYALIRCAPNKECRISRYGARSMNVYLLHMLLVFPLSYGVFSHLPHTPLWVGLNVTLVPLLGTLLFCDKVDGLMNRLLSKQSWLLVVVLYLFSLMLVNRSWLL